MNKVIKSFMAAALLMGGGSLVDSSDAFAQGSATVGSLRGVIRDKANGETAAGATVVATSPALQGEQVVITEADGQYFITSLPPGLYVLTVYYNDATFTRGNVLVQLGKEAVVNISIDSATNPDKPKGEVIQIQGSAPIVDQGSTKTGLTLTDDYTRNVPVGRTFGAVLGAAAGAQSDNYGVSFSGATSAENTYIVEGINTTDVHVGGLSSNLPTEFVSETEVITGGYNAEFGRATGGIVNVVTKSGSDEFHGSVFGYFQPGSFISGANSVPRQGGSIDSKTDVDYRHDVGAEVGGPIIKKKLWFHVGFNPSFRSSTTQRIINTQIDETGPNGMPDGVPDVNPDTGFIETRELSRSELGSSAQTYFFTAKVNGAVNQNHQFQVSAFGNPQTFKGAAGVVRNPNDANYKNTEGAFDFAGKWTSKLNEGKTQIDAVLGYHNGYTHDSPDGNDVPYISYNYYRSLYDFADFEGADRIAACEDDGPNDPYPGIVNCPVIRYGEQGLAFLYDRESKRTSGAISITQRVKGAGYHVLKAGIDAEFTTNNINNGYSGGAYIIRGANTAAGAPGRWQVQEFLTRVRPLSDAEKMDPSSVPLEPGQLLCANDLAICEPTSHLTADTSSRSIGAYVQDQWQIFPNLTANLGLRWEQQVGYVADQLKNQVTPEGEYIGEKAFSLDKNFAPRVGLIYDPTKEGKSKIFGHYGWFYENIPMDMNVRAFGGEITSFRLINANRYTPSSGNYDPNCDVDHTATTAGQQLLEKLNQCTDVAQQAVLGGGAGSFITPGLKAQRTDELVFGAEYQILPEFKVGANFVHRTLPTVIEDISFDGANTYLITNPGSNYDAEAEALQPQADMLLASSDPQERALGQIYQNRIDSMKRIKYADKPTRNYDAIQLTATQRPTRNSLLLASYTFSRSKGNYPGLFSTETGQPDPNITTMYDLPELMANRYGALGLDRPHLFKIDGFYMFDLKKAGAVTVGASLRAQTGIPHQVLGAHPVYGEGESYILPRGAGTRSEMLKQADVRLTYGYRVNKTTNIEAFVNIFNMFNSQVQLNQDENYTFDSVNPIVGGDSRDLQHVKTVDGLSGTEVNVTPAKNQNFGNTGANTGYITTVQQAPRALQLGFRVTF
ncbi:MAG TPA: TonB-dependent receptor [Kofleriaceae bacterium]|nr:TonB-dependent receptor [Kofleriaceae bacterium]